MGRESLPGGPPRELTEQRRGLVVFACGDPAHAEHDSVAIAAAAGLPADVLGRVDLKLTGPMRPEYLRDLAPDTRVVVADTVVLADAVADADTVVGADTAGVSSEIVRLSLLELSGRQEPLAASSTVDPPLDEVVAMGQLLRAEPLRGYFVGLTVAGVDLSAPPDEAQVGRLREALARVISELDGEP